MKTIRKMRKMKSRRFSTLGGTGRSLGGIKSDLGTLDS